MTKRILAILLALAMIFSLWCVEIVAADINVSSMKLEFEWTGSKDDYSGGSASLFTEAPADNSSFLKAFNTEGAVFEVEYNAVNGQALLNIFGYAPSNWVNGHNLGYPSGSGVARAYVSDILATAQHEGETNAVVFQFIPNQWAAEGTSPAEKVTISRIAVYVPASEGDLDERTIYDSGTVELANNAGYTSFDDYADSIDKSALFSALNTSGAKFIVTFAATTENGGQLKIVPPGSTWAEADSFTKGVGDDNTYTATFTVADICTQSITYLNNNSTNAVIKRLQVVAPAVAIECDHVGKGRVYVYDDVEHIAICTNCYEEIEDESGDHSAEEWETEDGSDTHWQICETCGVKFGEEAHDEKGTVGEAIDATCTEKGKTAGVKCSVCDTVIEEQKDTDALGHDWATEWSKDTNGHYKACLNGCSEKNEEAEHTFESTDDGEVCSECGYVDHEHVFTEVEYDKDGHWNKCTQCDTIDEDSKEEHTLTYTSDGEDEHTAECDVCDYTFTEAHTWDDGEVTAEPTETEDGETTYTCEVCGETKTEEIPATGSEDDDTDGDSEDDDAEDDNTGDSTDGVAYDSAPVALYNNAGYTSFQDYTEIDQAALVAALNTPGAILTITFEVTDPTGGGWLKLVPNGSDWSDAQCFTAGTAESQGKGPFTATFTNLNLTGQAFQYFNNNSKSNTVITRIVVTVPTTSTEPEPPTGTAPVAHHHAYVWLGDATGHRAFCHTCRTFLLQVSAHVYVNGTCALCGYKDPNAVSGGNTSGATKAAVEIEGLNIDSGAFNAVVYDGNLPAEFFEAIQVEGSVVNIKTTIPSGSADWSKIGFQETKSGSWPYTDGISATITADEDGNLVFSVNGPELYAQLDGGTFVEGSVQLYLNVTNSDGVKSTGKPYTTAVVVNVPAGDDTIEVEMPQEAAVAKTADETVAD